jgi:hypothetical protein
LLAHGHDAPHRSRERALFQAEAIPSDGTAAPGAPGCGKQGAMTRKTLLALAERLMAERATIPAQKTGEYEIRHGVYEKGCEFLLASEREAMFTGWPAASHFFPGPLIIHELKGPEGTWMSDIPSEVVQMHDEFAKRARGRVLIGGLGLGIAARMAMANPRVDSVTVVELSAEVIQMVGPFTPGVEIVHGNIFDFVRSLQPGQFDCVFFDTWQRTDEWVWQKQVVPLRRALGNKIKRIFCWRELMMVNEVALKMRRAASVPAEQFRGRTTCHYYAFSRGIRDLDELRDVPLVSDFSDPAALVAAEQANQQNERLEEALRSFVFGPGTRLWEKRFGRYWDEAAARDRAEKASNLES